MRSTRVLVLTPDFPPAIGGIQTLVHRLVQGWSRVEPYVVTLAQRGSAQVDASVRARVRRAGFDALSNHAAQLGFLGMVAVVEAVGVRPDVILSAHLVT